MESEQKKKQPENTLKISKTAKLAFAGLLSIAVPTAYKLDASMNNGFCRRSLMDSTFLMTFKLNVENPYLFPYSFSPWEEYARTEAQLLDKFNISKSEIPRETARIISIGNDISDRVAKRMLKAMDTYSVGDVSKIAERQSLMQIIAEEFANEGIFYTEESLLSNSVNPKLHEKGKIHLDCKLLSYLMCHIARRLNLEMYVVNGPSHMYVFISNSDGDRGYVIEPTEFRKIESGDGYVNYSGNGIGDGFFSSFEKQKVHAGIVATPRFEKAANFHVLVKDEQRIRDDIQASIIVGLMKYAERKNNLALKINVYNYLYNLVKRGTTSYLAVSNIFNFSISLADECIDAKHYEHAERALQNAKRVREDHNNLIVSKEPIEEVLLGKLYWEKGDKYRALRQLEAANELYERRGLFYIGNESTPMALNSYHCLLLGYLAAAELECGYMSRTRIYNEMVIPAYNFYVEHELTSDPEFKRISELKDKLS